MTNLSNLGLVRVPDNWFAGNVIDYVDVTIVKEEPIDNIVGFMR
jgi:hypothetical protein